MSHEPFIGLADGEEISLLRPALRPWRIDDIASALGKLCRFTGQCRHFYSVAEHSVMVSYLVQPEFAMLGLMHDAQEAFISDQSTPLKRYLSSVPFDSEAMIDGLCRILGANPSELAKVEAARHIREHVVTFDTVEATFEEAIEEAFDLVWTADARAAVKQADMTALVIEARSLFTRLGPSWDDILAKYKPSPRVAVQCWEPDTAARRFMDRWLELRGVHA